MPITFTDHAAVTLNGLLYAPQATVQVSSGDPQFACPPAHVAVVTSSANNVTVGMIVRDLQVTAAGSLSIANGNLLKPVVTVNTLATNNNKPALGGTVIDPVSGNKIARLTVFAGGQTLAATVTGNTWSLTLPTALADGTYNVQATATDSAGYVATCAAANALVVDTVKPVVTVAALTTTTNKPTLTGTVSDAAPSSGIVGVTVIVAGQRLAATVTGKTWSVAVPSALAGGTYNVVATATDFAGNTASDATTNELAVVTRKLDVTVTPLLTDNNQPTLTGTVVAQPGIAVTGVTLSVGGQNLTAVVSGNTWSATVPVALADGTYTVQATAKDNAGDTVSDQTSNELTIDTAGPAPPCAAWW